MKHQYKLRTKLLELKLYQIITVATCFTQQISNCLKKVHSLCTPLNTQRINLQNQAIQ
jgi:hypothetical protein